MDELITSLEPTRNQLQRAAISLSPEVAEVLLVLEGYPQARLVRMCGSGSTCMAITETADSARTLAQDIVQRYPHWWVRETVVRP
jgi:4-diphosphocytidyl-2-C-methyl-D-erythritol kinase